ncbi:hypothetical protein BJV82DRAFT_577272 [Fennellomyces sp. T-0311]|nr:hypothetical protein BJV82DRAFT_577272 [Fennellomyces sp. T-0311]
MFRHQLSNLSRLTSYTLKYAGMGTPQLLGSSSQDIPSAQLIEFWVAEAQRGLDALLNDQFDLAEAILSQHASVSPFHAVAYALMAYVEAMLAFDTEKVRIATVRIAAAEDLARQHGRRARRRGWAVAPGQQQQQQQQQPNYNDSISIAFDEDKIDTESSASSIDEQEPKRKSVTRRTFDLQCELLEINCILMGATTQFTGNSWLEYMKATYRLRKSYKMYEHMFTTLMGQKPSEYAAMLQKRKKTLEPTPTRLAQKRFSIFSFPTSARVDWEFRRRSFSGYDEQHDGGTKDSMVESGVLFGIGLFSLIFSLLPPKGAYVHDAVRMRFAHIVGAFLVNKILNTLGFHSSRPFALHILQKSYESQGLYSSLSALTLLVYFTNLSLFIHPRLLPGSMTPEATRAMLNHMKSKYPNSKIWELLEGKLYKMEGNPRKGVETLRDARRRRSTRVDLGGGTKKWVNGAVNECGDSEQRQRNRMVLNELGQLQGLTVYEMGWAQVFLGDYFQASETFFRLESMNNWSRAFYHYIATCCMFADEQYDKAGMEFHQIPNILDRKRQLGGRLLPNEMFAERKIKRWKDKAQIILSQGAYLPPHLQWMAQPPPQQPQQEYMKERYLLLDGELLKQVVVVNPLWELVYLWNGIPQLSREMLNTMKQQLQDTIDQQLKLPQPEDSDIAILRVISGAVLRELNDYTAAEKCFQGAVALDAQVFEDRWVIPYALYELAVLSCFRLDQSQDVQYASDARNFIKRAEQYFHFRRGQQHQQQPNDGSTGGAPPTSDDADHHDWENRLHIRCQLLIEKVDELHHHLSSD